MVPPLLLFNLKFDLFPIFLLKYNTDESSNSKDEGKKLRILGTDFTAFRMFSNPTTITYL